FAYVERARAFELLDLIRQHPSVPKQFKELTANSQTADRGQIQASLPSGTYLMVFSVFKDATYTWILSRDRFEVTQQNTTRQDVERWTAELHARAAKRDHEGFKRALHAPYEGLISLPLSVIKRESAGTGVRIVRIVIVPDGAMHGLPFSALRGPGTPYLIQEAPLAIAGSATLYLYSLARDAALNVTHPTALIVGNPAFNRALPHARGMQRLPYAEQEAREIQRTYGADAELLVGAEATVPAFLALARTKTLIHVAAHARPVPNAPSRSVILFAPSAKHWGALEAQELLTKLKLDQTKLVVLAACSSAGGLPVGPEGVAPLVRPLIAAGVPAVVGTLWDVDDATAQELMVSFHRHYEAGRDVTVALQQAQLDLLESKNIGHQSPLAWAPFQVIGHAGSPFGSTHQN
ncbi:MAG TPA: CHAT domain-containing protein, partial [Thermoanaerobaculia bacterium]